ncbi:MAG: polysaccharide biosynthesis-domain-containing protein [Monoraphidium minutum]|nr:MAG: polysaccharide biosynthesis-domain-containing protein [Monoraphidium minutum]
MAAHGQGTGSGALGPQLFVALLALAAAFMGGQRMGRGGLDDGAEPSSTIMPWKPTSGKCRSDYVSVIAEGAASKSPPQLSLAQMLWIASAVRGAKPHAAPADFLVFGLGYDSAIWAAANCGGTTVFLENMQAWIDTVTKKIPGITVKKVAYTSLLDKPAEFFRRPSEPDMPAEVRDACYDVVLVDSPMGWKKGAKQPGRFQPVYYAVNMARRCIREGKKAQVTIFVHDAQREVENTLIHTYLVAEDIRQVGKLNGRFGLLWGVIVAPTGALGKASTAARTQAEAAQVRAAQGLPMETADRRMLSVAA